MRYASDRAYSDPEKAARRLMDHARAFQPIQDGRIYIEQINHPFLFGDKGTPAEYTAGLKYAVAQGWLTLHERNVREADAKRRGTLRIGLH
jgi:hypothetical protein